MYKDRAELAARFDEIYSTAVEKFETDEPKMRNPVSAAASSALAMVAMELIWEQQQVLIEMSERLSKLESRNQQS